LCDDVGRNPWIVILVDVVGERCCFAAAVASGEVPMGDFTVKLLEELEGGEAETLDTTDETIDRSTGWGMID
jgi:hypothetical protein